MDETFDLAIIGTGEIAEVTMRSASTPTPTTATTTAISNRHIGRAAAGRRV